MQSRFSITQYTFFLAASLAVCCALLASARPAQASAFNYGGQLRTFECAMLMLPSAGEETNLPEDRPGPFVFYILNQRVDIRPAGWRVDNPLAPKTLTTDLVSRYSDYVDPVTHKPLVGAPVTPNMAVYWQVDIDNLTATTIREYDLLVVHTHLLVDLNSAQRALLRQYLDQGGTLLVDDCGVSGGIYGAGYLWRIGPALDFWPTFNSGTDRAEPAPDSASSPIKDNGIRSSPCPTISQVILRSINWATRMWVRTSLRYGRGQPNNTAFPPSPQPAAPDASIFSTVIANSANKDPNGVPYAYIAAGDYGSGHLIVSAADICDDISNPVGGNGYCGNEHSSGA